MDYKILNLGAGNRIIPEAENHDRIAHRKEIVTVWDLDDFPWPWNDESFEMIVARAVLEHLRANLLESVGECWRILKPGGVLVMKLPLWNHPNSYQDPTHYWQFDITTPEIFDPDTDYGRRYNFYMDKKWKIIKGPFMNKAKSSLHVTMQVRK